jgi:hypothetical protein
MADSQDATEIDPRKALAQRYMQKAHAELAAKDEKRPTAPRRDGPSSPVSASALVPRITSATYLHFLLLLPLITFTSLVLLWCYVLVNFSLMVGRFVLIPTGILTFITVSYASAYYLGLIESTSHGETTPEEALRGSWQDWFWMLPSTVGILAASAGIGYFISLPFDGSRWQIVGWATVALYPFLQLSSLETGAPFSLFSWPVMKTLLTRPLMWITVYAITFGLTKILIMAFHAAWRDPPYFTAAVMGPLITLSLLIYGVLLGTAARWMSLKSC